MDKLIKRLAKIQPWGVAIISFFHIIGLYFIVSFSISLAIFGATIGIIVGILLVIVLGGLLTKKALYMIHSLELASKIKKLKKEGASKELIMYHIRHSSWSKKIKEKALAEIEAEDIP